MAINKPYGDNARKGRGAHDAAKSKGYGRRSLDEAQPQVGEFMAHEPGRCQKIQGRSP